MKLSVVPALVPAAGLLQAPTPANGSDAGVNIQGMQPVERRLTVARPDRTDLNVGGSLTPRSYTFVVTSWPCWRGSGSARRALARGGAGVFCAGILKKVWLGADAWLM